MFRGNQMEVVSQFHAFPFLKQLTFYRNEQFALEARYNASDIPPAIAAIGWLQEITIDTILINMILTIK